jgi:hypothetical protein
LLAVLTPNRTIRKRTDANYSSFHLGVFLGLLNPRDRGRLALYLYRMITLVKEKAKVNLGMSRTTQMQLYKYLHVP